ncbi:uncharacterized protein BDR25DRAFT_350517 [Lindgomyces ingoldianus]|uniref:Uncharacterized protein n=1 Tax=Lindgomyces ingoldianus TaxID=673940 RepID=A0ACB6R9B3_9PLEO|nr:uncharacterized protein BDR25DRAFT_350517 [Lindgomyces ingoldianus]KAF2475107.1 hypothetical protein BDR25DRAFT_350517 [Lindgomyces ingoldianus]
MNFLGPSYPIFRIPRGFRIPGLEELCAVLDPLSNMLESSGFLLCYLITSHSLSFPGRAKFLPFTYRPALCRRATILTKPMALPCYHDSINKHLPPVSKYRASSDFSENSSQPPSPALLPLPQITPFSQASYFSMWKKSLKYSLFQQFLRTLLPLCEISKYGLDAHKAFTFQRYTCASPPALHLLYTSTSQGVTLKSHTLKSMFSFDETIPNTPTPRPDIFKPKCPYRLASLREWNENEGLKIENLEWLEAEHVEQFYYRRVRLHEECEPKWNLVRPELHIHRLQNGNRIEDPTRSSFLDRSAPKALEVLGWEKKAGRFLEDDSQRGLFFQIQRIHLLPVATCTTLVKTCILPRSRKMALKDCRNNSCLVTLLWETARRPEKALESFQELPLCCDQMKELRLDVLH